MSIVIFPIHHPKEPQERTFSVPIRSYFSMTSCYHHLQFGLDACEQWTFCIGITSFWLSNWHVLKTDATI